jgi:hypothetical protein
MASVVDICNLSLSHIGQSATITSIDPHDGGANSSHCARFFPLARDEALETYAWRFALKRKALATPTDAEIPDSYEYAYSLPSDYIRALSIFSDEYASDHIGAADYIIEGDLIFTNMEDATLHYISRVTDTSKWSPSFTLAVSWRLAQYLAGVTVKGDVQMRSFCAKQYQETLMHAAGMNANAGKTQPVHTPVWMSDR